MKENFDVCFDHVIGSEGGYTDDPNDKGNWTGCNVGKGQLKGTMYGVSACAYPHLDIKNLTLDDAKAIYKEDYWHVLQSDYVPWGVDLCLFDSGINSGNSQAAKWLQRAVGAEVDGVVGPETLAKTKAVADDHITVDRMCDDRLDMLRGLSTWNLYGKGWTNRVEKVRDDAHDMVDEHEGEVAPPLPGPAMGEILVAVTAPEGVTVSVLVNGVER